jgi:type IV secretion system protein VirB4
VNELYVTVIYKQDKQGAAIVEFLYKKLLQKGDKDAWSREMYEMAEDLSEVLGRILNTFKDYDTQLLGIESTKNGNFCRILEFLGKIANCSHEIEIGVSKMPIDKYIPNTRLFFGSKSLEARTAKGSKYAGIISIKEYSPSTHSGIFDRFLQL